MKTNNYKLLLITYTNFDLKKYDGSALITTYLITDYKGKYMFNTKYS